MSTGKKKKLTNLQDEIIKRTLVASLAVKLKQIKKK